MRKNLRNVISVICGASLLASCGGGGNSGAPPVTIAPNAGGGTSTTPVSGICSLRSRQDWVAAQLNDWYLFPETLPAALDPSGFGSVTDYLNALTATARSQDRDNFFTFVTSIERENAFFSSGSNAGFGIRIAYDVPARRALIAEAFEGAPGLAAGIDRGTELLAVGTTNNDLADVSALLASGGPAAVSNALGPATAGLVRVMRIRTAGVTSIVSVTKADFNIQPVSSRYGAQIINDGGRRIAYFNLRTFISTADNQMRNAFADFRAQGVNDFIVDFRYNGGGLVSTAELLSNLLGGGRSRTDVLSRTTFRPSRNNNDRTALFQAQPQSVSPIKIAFIGTRSTASASELVMNSFNPFLGVNAALIGTDTSGKPVGQIALDQAACDDRLRVVAFSTQNSADEGFYYSGMARLMRSTCAATDDVTFPLGDPRENSVARAIDFIQGRSCTAIVPAALSAKPNGGEIGAGFYGSGASPVMLSPAEPTPAQREMPGLF